MLFLPALSGEFLRWDDPRYVTENPHVVSGLSWENWNWAWTTWEGGNWNPLTWLSLQLDAAMWGVSAAAFHQTNVLLHALAAACLCLAILRLTGNRAVSAATALLFAVHPLRVESVAWISERKDVLSVAWGTAALWAYGCYAVRPGLWRWGLVTELFCASLLSKPMLVTFPCCLLLLDYWPLARGKTVSWRWLILEKIPWLAMSLAISWITLQAQHSRQTIMNSALPDRVANAVVAVGTYLRQTVWPGGLAAFYPRTQLSLTAWPVLLIAGGLLVLGAGCLWQRRRPYLLVGWLWFLGTLVPVLGIFAQQGLQGHADRFTYWPQIGLLLAVTSLVQTLCAGKPAWNRLAVMLLVTSSLALAGITLRNISFWKETETLWLRTVEVTEPNAVAQDALGLLYMRQQKYAAAEERFRVAVGIDGSYSIARTNLGALLLEMGRWDDAEVELRRATEQEPGNALAWHGWGWTQLQRGQAAEGRQGLQRSLALQPGNVLVLVRLGGAWLDARQFPPAQEAFVQALRIAPQQAGILIEQTSHEWQDDSRVQEFMATLLAEHGQVVAAIRILEQAVLSQKLSREAKARLNEKLNQYRPQRS